MVAELAAPGVVVEIEAVAATSAVPAFGPDPAVAHALEQAFSR
ncbi:hypothetical protein ACIHDR_27155 [Nocardia sp. NPDC052278]